MGFLLIGLVLLALKLAEIGPVANWSWLWILMPFGMAVLWWAFSDSIGLTRRREMRKMDERKAERRNRALEALGIDTRRERQVRKAREAARKAAPPPKDNPRS